MNTTSNNIVRRRNFDLATKRPFDASETVIDLGAMPVPGLFFSSQESAASALAPLRLIKSSASGLIQLDTDLRPDLYTHYKAGAATAAHLNFLESIADRFTEKYGPKTRILEIGGGAGHLMRLLKRRGFQELYTIDPSLENLNSPDYTVIRGLFPNALEDQGRMFDVIIGQHFLEHSHEPVIVLKAARKLLTPNGEIWIEVPDIEKSALEDNGAWLSIIYALHSSYFDKKTLSFTAAIAGLETIDISTVNHYGKSILAVFKPLSRSANPPQMVSCTIEHDPVCTAIKLHFRRLQQFGTTVPSDIVCWGAAERCLAILGACMSGGFTPGIIIDSNPDLRGLYPSGMSRSIKSPDEIDGPLTAALILSPQNLHAITALNPRLFAPSTRVYCPTY